MDYTDRTTGILHRYAPPKLVAFEHTPSSTHAPNKLLFIGGLGDGLFSVPYVPHLASSALPPNWSLVEVLTSSSYTGWGTGSVKRDTEELRKAVEYFRKQGGGEGKIVLMGHSTGSQDTLQYLLDLKEKGEDVRLDGAILQAPVSDREAIISMTNKTAYLTSIEFADSWIKSGQGDEVIPRQMRPGFEDTPISAERWFSIAAPLDADGMPQGSEDFFSSDIKPELLKETFGRIPKGSKVLLLGSAEDQFVPEHVDKEALMSRWTVVCKEAGVEVAEGTGWVPGAKHEFKDTSSKVMADLTSRVKAFLENV